jgi:ATP-dependent RNA helicase RhlE
VQVLVLDEADRMLDMGFMPDLKRILALLPKQRQNMMFSATFSNEIKKLADDFLTNPTLIEVARSNASNENITQQAYAVSAASKQAFLVQLLKEAETNQVIVFTKTKLTASRLARALQKENISADAIHGDKSQKERIEALDAFKAGKVMALVATDVAARGLDISDLPMVINYEIPSAPEDYVHRIGRTGRAGASGVAISLICEDEEKYFLEIEKLMKKTIVRQTAQVTSSRVDAPRSISSKEKKTRPASTATQGTHAQRPKRTASDPWFNKPYEPSAVMTKTTSKAAISQSRKAPLAALLGGLKPRS